MADEVKRPTGPDDLILDRAMWYFWTDLARQDRAERFMHEPPPQDGVNAPEPRGSAPGCSLLLPIHQPPWNAANYWGKSFTISTTVCMLFYKTWYNIISGFVVPDNYMVIVNKISYEIPQLPINEVFEIEALRSSERLGVFEDIKINNLTGGEPNPAKQYALGGHFLPIPTFMRWDSNQDINFRMRVMGIEQPIGNFPRTETDVLNCTGRIVIQGWMSSMLQNTDNAPRPVDPGYPLDAYGDPYADEAFLAAAKGALALCHNGERQWPPAL
jgi:hypothetical protein